MLFDSVRLIVVVVSPMVPVTQINAPIAASHSQETFPSTSLAPCVSVTTEEKRGDFYG